jgi:lambda repressor-like predicted transcriptional regulator
MHPADIKAALEKKEVSQLSIAKELGVAAQSVGDVIRKKTVSDRIMRAISSAIGEDYRKVFPEYYLKKPKRKNSKTATI